MLKSPSSETDLEAQFRLRLFALLGSPTALCQLVQSNSVVSSSARLDLARFLAGYYLDFDFGRLFGRLNRYHQFIAKSNVTLPNLLIWSEQDEEDLETYKNEKADRSNCWERCRLGQLLPSECSPGFALRLLLREQRYLEAIFFADHFNAFRTSMALRYLADRCCSGLNLFAQQCHIVLVDQFLELIENGDNDLEQTMIQNYIEAIVQADVLFPEEFGTDGLLNEAITALTSMMGTQFGALLEFDDSSDHNGCLLRIPSAHTIQRILPQLPRPPIYCSPASVPSSPHHFDNNSEETRAWMTLHFCYIALSYAFARSNRLSQMIGFFALWLSQRQTVEGIGMPMSELPFLLEAEYFTNGQTETELMTELNAFQTMFSVALGMQIRDKIVRMLAKSEKNSELGNVESVSSDEAIEGIGEKLAALATPFCNDNEQFTGKCRKSNSELIWHSLRKWAQLADDEDIESASLFLHIIQRQNEPPTQRHKFLPPLNGQNRPKWRSLLLSEEGNLINDNNSAGNWTTHMDVFVDEGHKLKLLASDFVRFRFLARHFQSVPLPSPLIQMRLELDPSEICSIIEAEQHLPMIKSGPPSEQKLKSDKKFENDFGTSNVGNGTHNGEEGDELDAVIAQIRASLKCLEEEDDNDDHGKQHWESVPNLLNGPEKNANSDEQQQPMASSSDSEAKYIDRMRERIWHELERRQRGIPTCSSSADDAPTSDIPSQTIRSSGSSRSSRFRTKRRETAKIRRKSHRSEKNGSNRLGTGENAVPTDEQLKREMNTIGLRLEWIREHFQRRNNILEADEGQKSEEFSTRTVDKQSESLKRPSKSDQEFEDTKSEHAARSDHSNNEQRINENTKKVPPQSPLSSAGYHSSRPSTSQSASFRIKEDQVPPLNVEVKAPMVERMDFSGLRSSDEEDLAKDEAEANDGTVTMGEKKRKEASKGKRRLWTEIEVFPRNSPPHPLPANPSSTTESTRTVPNLEEKAESPPIAKIKHTEKDAETRKSNWRRPHWLRLLPPFDGTVKTERQPKIHLERPMLELKLDDIYATQRNPDNAMCRTSTTVDAVRRRTFLEVGTKREIGPSQKTKNIQNVRPKTAKTENSEKDKQQQQTATFGIYDSGIELDQHHQQHNNPINNGHSSNTTTSVAIIYSAELDEAEIEEMRRRAGIVRE